MWKHFQPDCDWETSNAKVRFQLYYLVRGPSWHRAQLEYAKLGIEFLGRRIYTLKITRP